MTREIAEAVLLGAGPGGGGVGRGLWRVAAPRGVGCGHAGHELRGRWRREPR